MGGMYKSLSRLLLAEAMPTAKAPNHVGAVYPYDLPFRKARCEDVQSPLVIFVIAVRGYHYGGIRNIEIGVRCR